MLFVSNSIFAEEEQRIEHSKFVGVYKNREIILFENQFLVLDEGSRKKESYSGGAVVNSANKKPDAALHHRIVCE